MVNVIKAKDAKRLSMRGYNLETLLDEANSLIIKVAEQGGNHCVIDIDAADQILAGSFKTVFTEAGYDVYGRIFNDSEKGLQEEVTISWNNVTC